MQGLLYFIGFYAAIALALFLYKYLSKAFELYKYNKKFKKIYVDLEAFNVELIKQKKEKLVTDFKEQKKSLNDNFKFTYDIKEKSIVEDLLQGDEQWRNLTTRKKSYKKHRRF